MASFDHQGQSDPVRMFANAPTSRVTNSRPTEEPRTIESERPFPLFAIRRFADEVGKVAVVEQMEDGRYFVEADSIEGAWGDGSTEAEARQSFGESVYKWAMEKMLDRDGDIPVIGDVDLNTFS
jgi:predicted RNase H-like HicB family nuclease